MKVIYEATSQGATLRVYHHGYITITPGATGDGFQVYPERLDGLIGAIAQSVAEDGEPSSLSGVYQAAWDSFLDGSERGELRTMYQRAHEYALGRIEIFLSNAPGKEDRA